MVLLVPTIVSPCYRVECGAPPVDWQTAKDSVAPEGWAIWNFQEHAGNLRACGNGWNAYAYMQERGKLYATMKGYGRATVKYKDCWGEGFASLYLNGKPIDKSGAYSSELRTFRFFGRMAFYFARVAVTRLFCAPPSFYFNDDDLLMFMDDGDNSVLHIESIVYSDCTGLLRV